MWFDMTFVVGNQGRIVETSDTMWNVGELIHWLEQIFNAADNAAMDVDREGAIDLLEAKYMDEKRLHLRICDSLTPSMIFIDAVVSRKKLVWEIYSEMQAWALVLGQDRHPKYVKTDPNWLKNPQIEAWLDWEPTKDWMKDDLVEGYR